jgi:carbon monoxide dehydrogenase subunit G
VKLQLQTEVAAPPEDVWDFLQDTRAVVQCVPGAELVDELGDDRYQGVLRLAIGPLKMNYAGDVSVVERNAGDRRIVLDATGRDKRGSGTAQASVQLQVSPAGHGTRIDVVSDLDLTGRIASLGRGVRDVSNRMFVQFAEQLGDRLVSPDGAAGQAEPAPLNGALPAAAGGSPEVSNAGRGVSSVATSPRQNAASARTTPSPSRSAGEIKVLPLVWNVTRDRVADFLERLSSRVRPH